MENNYSTEAINVRYNSSDIGKKTERRRYFVGDNTAFLLTAHLSQTNKVTANIHLYSAMNGRKNAI